MSFFQITVECTAYMHPKGAALENEYFAVGNKMVPVCFLIREFWAAASQRLSGSVL